MGKPEPVHFRLGYEQTLQFYAEALRSAWLAGGAAELNKTRANLGKIDLFFLLVFVLKRVDINRKWLFERCREVQRDPDDHLDLWSRYHYKSSIGTFGMTIFDIINDPEITIGIFAYNSTLATEFLKQIKAELERNEDLPLLYPEVFYKNPAKEAPQWSESGITVKRTQNPKEATVEAYGLVKGQPIGRHYKLRVYDDVVTPDSVSTPEQIHKTTEAVRMSSNLGILGGGRKRFYGTRYHLFDTYRVLIDDEVVKPRIYPATHNGLENGVPVLMTAENIALARKDAGPYGFASQFLMNPVADSAMGFRAEWFIRGDTDYNLAMKRLWRFIIVDPAGGKQRKGNDYTTMFVIGHGEDGKFRVLDIRRDRMRLTQRSETLIELHRQWKPQLVAYEDYGMQADIEHIKHVQKEQLYEFDIHPLGGSMKKELRILRLVPYFEQGRIIFPTYLNRIDYQGQTRDLVKDFEREEYTAFPVLKHDDMCFVAGTIIATNKGRVPIELIKIGDMVLTPDGFKEVVHSGCTGYREVMSIFGLTGTPDHPIFSIENSYKRLDTLSSINETIGLKLCDWIKIALLKLLCSMEQNSVEWEEVADTISLNQQRTQGAKTLKGFMSLFGSIFQGKSVLEIMKLTTRMATLLTASLKIWSAYQKAYIAQYLKKLIWIKLEKTSIFKDQKPLNGTNHQKEKNGTSNTLRRQLKRFLSKGIMSVYNARKYSQQESRALLSTVRTSAEKDIEENYQKVYNLTVADAHCYFANGILVHNCDCLSRIDDLVAEKLIQSPISTNVDDSRDRIQSRIMSAQSKVNGSKPAWMT